MAVNSEVQPLLRRGIVLTPLWMAALALMLSAAVVMGVLVGRWTAPSTTGLRQAEIAAPARGAEGTFVPGVTDFPSFGSARPADPFVPGVTDFPSFGSAAHADPFVPGVTDFGS